MTALTFTADSTTDVITSVAHGLNTGDGAAAVINIGGALPGGLTGGATDYYFIRLTADTGKLATSNANALAGTAIDITSNGTGVQQLCIGLPYRRPRTYTALSQVKSTDLNAMFDATTGAKRQSFSRTWIPNFKGFTPGGSLLYGVNTLNAGFPHAYATTAQVTFSAFDIPFDDGDRLIGFKYWACGNTTVDLTSGRITYGAAMGSASADLTTWVDNNRAATWALVDVGAIGTTPAFAAQLLAAGAALQVLMLINAAGYNIGPCTAIFDRGA